MIKYLFIFIILSLNVIAQPFMLGDPAIYTFPNATSGSGSVSISYITNHSTNSTQSTYIFPGVSLGSEAVNRKVWIMVGSRDTGTTLTLNTLTVSNSIGGLVSATLAVGTNNTSGGNISLSQAWYVDFPSGTTGDITLTFNEATLRANIGIYRVTGQTSFETDAEITATTSMSMSVNGVANGALISSVLSASSTSFSWTGTTEDYDAAVGTSTASGSSDSTPDVGSNTVTPTAAASGSTAGVLVSISP